MTESTPDFPDPGVYWRMVEEFGVTILYTAPTADTDVHEAREGVAG